MVGISSSAWFERRANRREPENENFEVTGIYSRSWRSYADRLLSTSYGGFQRACCQASTGSTDWRGAGLGGLQPMARR